MLRTFPHGHQFYFSWADPGICRLAGPYGDSTLHHSRSCYHGSCAILNPQQWSVGLRLLPTLANAHYLVGTWVSPSLMSDDISFGHLVTYLLISVSPPQRRMLSDPLLICYLVLLSPLSHHNGYESDTRCVAHSYFLHFFPFLDGVLRNTKFFIVMTSSLFLFFFSSLFLASCPGMCG